MINIEKITNRQMPESINSAEFPAWLDGMARASLGADIGANNDNLTQRQVDTRASLLHENALNRAAANGEPSDRAIMEEIQRQAVIEATAYNNALAAQMARRTARDAQPTTFPGTALNTVPRGFAPSADNDQGVDTPAVSEKLSRVIGR